MSDTTMREAVLKEFDTGVLDDTADNLADEILRLRAANKDVIDRAERAERILAALREPSFEVVKAAAELITRTNKNFPSRAIRAAVKAAEQEVGRE